MRTNTLKNKTILLVNTGSTHKRHVLKRLKQLELKVIALNKERNWAQPYVDEWVIADNSNHNEALTALDTFLKEHPEIKLDGALTFWEDDVLLTSKITDKYGLIGIPFTIASQVRNKFAFRQFCADNGLPFPQFKAVKTEADFQYVNKHFKYPLVIKPAFGAQSNFVMKVENKSELINSYNFIKSNISAGVESALQDGLEIFIEEFIEGDEVDVDILLQNGKVKFAVVSDNFDKTFNEFFIDKGQSAPSSLSAEKQQDLIDMCEDTLEKLGIFNGCIHYEAKATRNGPFPIEVNMRMGGDYVWSYIKDAWDVDLIENAAKIATGELVKFPNNLKPKKFVIGWDLHPEESGILAELDIPDDFEQLPYVEDLTMYKEIGEPVLVPPEYTDTIGWITVSGENFLDAQDNLTKALDEMSFNVVKFDTESSLGKTIRKNRYATAKINQQILIKTAKLEKIKKLDKENLKKIRIGVIGNYNDLTTNPIDVELNQTARYVARTLKENGYNIVSLNVDDFPKFVRELEGQNIDLILNLAKKINNSAYLGTQLPTFFEAFNIPYVGSDTNASMLAKDKIKFKKLLTYHTIPTPDWDYVYSLDDEVDEELEFPLIVKPAVFDSSIGITNESVVHNKKELKAQIKKMLTEIKSPALIEEYIEGDEYRVSIIGNSESDLQILPLSRTIFTELLGTYEHIFTYDSKWSDNKIYDNLISQYPVKNINKKLETLLTEIALDTFRITRSRDYAVVEIRVDEDDNPYVLEIGTDPSLSPTGELNKVAQIAKINYVDLIEEVILAGISRYKKGNGNNLVTY